WGRDRDQTETRTGVRIRLGPKSGSNQTRGQDRSVAAPFQGWRSRAVPPAPSSSCPGTLPAVRVAGPGALRGAPVRAAPADREHRDRERGAHSPRPQETLQADPARRRGDFPGQAHGSRGQKSPSLRSRPLCPRDSPGTLRAPGAISDRGTEVTGAPRSHRSLPSHRNAKGSAGNVSGAGRDPGSSLGVAGNHFGELRRRYSDGNALLPLPLSALTYLWDTPHRPGLLAALGGSPGLQPEGLSLTTVGGALQGDSSGALKG
ncbi:uncharacterized protein LOC120505105, partial [Passer montanus]|uniref:uncharacterized protein LOC120505105 n=1 Tax=Passer montanus TaxID=9160 RepID=UPI0019610B82